MKTYWMKLKNGKISPLRIGFNRILPDGKIGGWIQTLTKCGYVSTIEQLYKIMLDVFGTDIIY
jgi:hypothetical protein